MAISRVMFKVTAAAVAAVPLALVPVGLAQAAVTTHVITAADTVSGSSPSDERFTTSGGSAPGAVTFVNGPGTPPSGTGSVHLQTPSGKANISSAVTADPTTTNSYFTGIPLSSLVLHSYSTYRSSTSTNTANPQQAPSLQIAVYRTGTGSFSTFAFEPQYSQQASPSTVPSVISDTWQTWTTDGTAKGWYDTKNQGTNNTQSLDDLKALYPNATVLDVGLNQGSGNDGLDAYADAISATTTAGDALFDFELADATPVPALAESPVAVLLPLGALAMLGTATVIRRRARVQA